jgi:Cytochrome P450
LTLSLDDLSTFLSTTIYSFGENGTDTLQPCRFKHHLGGSLSGLSTTSKEIQTTPGNQETSWAQRLLHLLDLTTKANFLPGIPVLGSVPELPAQHAWLQFCKWSKQYGPICQVQLGPDTIVLISDTKIAEELLVKRQAIYSSRVHFAAIWGDCTTDVHYLPLMAAGGTSPRSKYV